LGFGSTAWVAARSESRVCRCLEGVRGHGHGEMLPVCSAVRQDGMGWDGCKSNPTQPTQPVDRKKASLDFDLGSRYHCHIPDAPKDFNAASTLSKLLLLLHSRIWGRIRPISDLSKLHRAFSRHCRGLVVLHVKFRSSSRVGDITTTSVVSCILEATNTTHYHCEELLRLKAYCSQRGEVCGWREKSKGTDPFWALNGSSCFHPNPRKQQ
jgi:hypothetical protein